MGKPKDRRYTPTAQVFHWLIALLIVVQFVLARMAAPLPLGAHKLALLAEHKSFGMTVLMLALIHRAPAIITRGIQASLHSTTRGAVLATLALATRNDMNLRVTAIPDDYPFNGLLDLKPE